MNKLTFSAILCALFGTLIDSRLISSMLLLYACAALLASAAKDFKKARRLHNELKKDKT